MNWRYRVAFLILCLLLIAVLGRLFYWQVIMASDLHDLAVSQYDRVLKIVPNRGEIKTSDGFPIAANKISYLVFANPKEIKDKKNLAGTLANTLKIDEASISAQLSLDLLWVPIKSAIDSETKKSVESLNLPGVGFEEKHIRFYPEASMAAHLLGFVGKDSEGNNKGYFGLEGYYDRLLRGKESYVISIQDAFGRPIVARTNNSPKVDGSSLILSVDRAIQFLVERKLKDGIEKYNASSGMIGIMNPKTGQILAMTHYPTFEPALYQEYQEDVYKNPFVSNSYEPGSTLKPIIMSAALDAKVIKPETRCPICDGPISVGGYELRTWNNKYYKDTSMIDVIKHSDNVGMAYVAQKLGVDGMISYLKKFGIGELTYIDSQGEVAPSLKPKNAWYPVDLATTGFGQGISVTPIELLSAFSAIANNGKIMQPFVVSSLESPSGEISKIKKKVLRNPISQHTAKVMTEILVNAVNKGEANWTRLKGYRIAGKTGTASIPVAGHYDPQKTITSFIGFAPADDPKFVMLVILDKPTSSIYAAETAAPLFFDISRDILSYYGIPPTE